jgi:putative ABC transport system permease protein
LPRARAIAIDGRALAFTMGLALFTGAGFGLAPALQSMRTDPHEILKRGATEGRRRHRLRGALVVGEIAIALVLLAGAGLLMRSFFRLAQVSPGFDPRDALTVRLNLDDSHQAMAQPAIFVQGVTERLAALPGVQAVAVAARFPFAENPLTIPFSIAGRPEVTEGDRPITNHYQVGPDYFRAMRIPILRGRAFGPGDVDGAHRVAVVSQSLARRYFAAEDPLGKTITIFGPPSEIVGIAGDVRVDRLDGEPSPQSYQPFAQVSWTKANFVIRTAGPAAGYIEPVRAAIARLDRDVPVYNVRTFSTLVASSIARQRFAMILFAVFSGVALLLAAVGIYGVMSYWVSQRRGEIGIRMALGAHTGAVLRMVLAQGSRLIGLGLVIGLVGALLLTKFLERLLYQLSARDPLTFAAMVALLAATAATACLLPARRAARVDPMKVLRAE